MKIKVVSVLLIFIAASSAMAEPYFAVRDGLHCSSCHVNPTGGGMRSAFGDLYGQNDLPVNVLTPGGNGPWTGELSGPIRIGGNGRYSGRYFDVDELDTNANFSVDRASIYLGAELNDRVSFMIDQQVAPGGSLNREAWAKINFGSGYIKAGKFFRPFGWRIEDDGAFIRQITGINFTN